GNETGGEVADTSGDSDEVWTTSKGDAESRLRSMSGEDKVDASGRAKDSCKLCVETWDSAGEGGIVGVG
ncbi:hypothetical protein A2U01_0101136, partial [Trifolium medium]|nr:hypothetical protein [Trifolium medium]